MEFPEGSNAAHLLQIWPCFHMTLPQGPSYGEGDSSVYRDQHSVYYFWLLFLLVVPKVRVSECLKAIAIPGTTSSPAMRQGSKFLEWAVSISLSRLLMKGEDDGSSVSSSAP